jgi:hypothetical protein
MKLPTRQTGDLLRNAAATSLLNASVNSTLKDTAAKCSYSSHVLVTVQNKTANVTDT